MRSSALRPGCFLYQQAVTLVNLGEKYGKRPSEFVTWRRATPEDLMQFDLAVTLWAGAEALQDHAWAKRHASQG